MKYFRQILQELNLTKKKWEIVDLKSLDKETRDELWDMYVDTYQTIGLHIDSSENLLKKYKISWLIDYDSDPKIDAFIIYKETTYGNKIALLGSDENKQNKKVLLNKLIELLKTRYWYIEASHKLADIIEHNKIKVIYDKKIVNKILDNKVIEFLDNGEYKRKLSSLGVVKKKMFGNVKM